MTKTPVWVITADMANEQLLADQGRGSIVNLEIIRAGAVTAELKLNIEKAHKLIHTARNLITVRGLMLEQIHWRKHRSLTNHQPYSSCAAGASIMLLRDHPLMSYWGARNCRPPGYGRMDGNEYR